MPAFFYIYFLNPARFKDEAKGFKDAVLVGTMPPNPEWRIAEIDY
jgi:hypothetical protein